MAEPERTELSREAFTTLLHHAVDELMASLPETARFADAKELRRGERITWGPHLYWTQWYIGPLAEVWMPNDYYAGPPPSPPATATRRRRKE